MFRYLIVCVFFLVGTVNADVPPNQVNEVNHLLEFVKNSACTINRNGTAHLAKKSAGHIENKYAYFSKVEVSFPGATRAQTVEGAKKAFGVVLPERSAG